MPHLVSGLLLIVFGLWGMSAWWISFGLVMRGLLPFGLLLTGLVAVLSSYYRLNHRPAVLHDELEEK